MTTARRITLVMACAGAMIAAEARADQPVRGLRNELIVFGLNGSFDDYPRSADRTLSLQYYYTASPSAKIFVEAGTHRRFEANDQSVGGGFYYNLDRQNSFYGYGMVGINADQIPLVDITGEYTRLLVPRVTAGIGYRYARFKDETVHMALPSFTLYTFPRWTLASRFYLSYIQSTGDVRFSYLLRVSYDVSERFVPMLWYSVGSEAYRGGTIDEVRSAYSWSLGAGGKFELNRWLRLRFGYEYLYRIEVFHQHTLTVSFSVLW
jgi:YaiO family outer membrane protein